MTFHDCRNHAAEMCNNDRSILERRNLSRSSIKANLSAAEWAETFAENAASCPGTKQSQIQLYSRVSTE